MVYCRPANVLFLPAYIKKIKTYNSSLCYSSAYLHITGFNFSDQSYCVKLLHYYISILNFYNTTA